MKNDQRTNISLIETIEMCPELWDYEHDKYSNKQHTEKKWQEVATVMNDTAQICKDRWNNIRGCYSRYLKAPRNDSTAKCRKEYYLAPFLSFLTPFMKSRPAVGNITRSQVEVEEVEDAEDTAIWFFQESVDESRNNATKDDELNAICDISYNTREQHVLRKGKEKKNPKEPGKRKESGSEGKESDHFEHEDVCDYVAIKKRKSEQRLDDDRAADRYFLLSLLPDVTKLKGRKKNRFKMRVIQLIDKLRYNDNDDVTSVSTDRSCALHSPGSSPHSPRRHDASDGQSIGIFST